MKIQLEVSEAVLPGTVSEAMAKCGKKNCRCNKDPSQMHGPYYRWTGTIDGKRTTITLTKEEADECRKRIKNWKKLQKDMALIEKKALSRAPWTDR